MSSDRIKDQDGKDKTATTNQAIKSSKASQIAIWLLLGGNWHVSDEAFDKLVELCVDICERNGIEEINYTDDTTGNLTYHGMFDKSTACPGPYMKSRMDDLANAINAELERG